jgi:hypothetical protein
MTKQLLAATAVLLASCSSEVPTYKFIPLREVRGLNDCSLIEMQTDGTRVFIVRCPNSEVNTLWKAADGKMNMVSIKDGGGA